MKKEPVKYICLGGDAVLEDTEIVGIFDLDNTSWSHLTRRFLTLAERDGRMINAAEDLPRSFVLRGDETVILTQPSTATLARRLEDQEKTNG